MAQWWERSPPTAVARVRFPDHASHVGWVCCWFSFLLRGFFSGFSGFPPSTKTNTPNSNSIWKQWTNSHLVEVPLLNPIYLFIILFIFISTTFIDELGFLLAQNVLLKQTIFSYFFCHWYVLVSWEIESFLVWRKLDSATWHDYKSTNLHFAAVRCEKWEVLSLFQ